MELNARTVFEATKPPDIRQGKHTVEPTRAPYLGHQTRSQTTAAAMDMNELAGIFKQHFTFAIALNAAQRSVTSTPTAVVPYLLAAAAFIAVLKIVTPSKEASGPFYMLATQSAQVATQIISSLLGTWITAMIGTDASTDKLVASAVLGLVMVWIASRALK